MYGEKIDLNFLCRPIRKSNLEENNTGNSIASKNLISKKAISKNLMSRKLIL